MTAAGGTACAGLRAGVGVDAEFQTFAVNVIGKGFDARGKVFRIGNDVAVFFARDLPAVVDDDVLVAGVFHAGLHHGVGCLAKEIFVDVALEFVPAVPAHGWSGGESLGRESLRVAQDRNCHEKKVH